MRYCIYSKYTLISLFSLITVTMTAQTDAVENLILSTPQHESGEIVVCKTIRLRKGFQFKTEGGKTLRLKSDASVCTPFVYDTVSPNPGKNFVMTVIPLDATSRLEYENDRLTVDRDTRMQTQIQFVDGLGRPSQTIQKGITPTGGDLVSGVYYNDRGLPYQEWLPTPIGNNSGQFVAPLDQRNSALDFYNNLRPFATTEYEPSPLNRAIETIGPGWVWYKSGVGNSNGIYTQYLTNDQSAELSVRNYRVGATLVKQGDYTAGSLYVTKTVDENKHAGYQFTDKSGRIVLNRRVANGSNYDTYYVYDNTGNLRYVIPPKAADLFTADKTYSQSELRPLVYIYNYDDSKRRVETFIPGADAVYSVYDKMGQLILTQDGNQRKKQEWSFNIPDKYGRIVISGTMTSPTKPNIAGVKVQTEWAGGSEGFAATGYTLPENIALTQAEILSVNYYGHYGFRALPDYGNPAYAYNMPAEIADTRYGSDSEVSRHIGLLTGSKSRILDTNRFLRNTYYYDAKSRLVQTVCENQTGGFDRESFAYDFSGQPVRKIHHQTVGSGFSFTEQYTYTYDHAGRPTETRHRIDDKPEQSILRLTYDEIGRLSQRRQGGLTPTSYSYNIRSWVREIDNPAYFKQVNHYATTPQYGKPNFNGNISWIEHTGWHKDTGGQPARHERNINLQYDGLDQLTLYDIRDNRPDQDLNMESFVYDKNGNITGLTRGYKDQLVDDLSFSYNGNQMTKVADSGYDMYLSEIPQILCGIYENAFAYDANGNLTKDTPRQIDSIRYNKINLPRKFYFSTENRTVEYIYRADGTKLEAVYNNKVPAIAIPAAENITSDKTPLFSMSSFVKYIANAVYRSMTPDKIYFDGGYVKYNPGSKTYEYYYYIQDHLNSNRAVVKEDGTLIQAADYLASGIATSEFDGLSKDNRLHTGKEFDSMHGLNLYDNQARMYDPIYGKFTGLDPLADHPKQIAWSPYSACANNPIRNIDPDGRIWENPKDEKRLRKAVNKRIEKLNKRNTKMQAKVDRGRLSDKKSGKYQNKQAENKDKIGFLNQSLADIKAIGDAKEVYSLVGASQSDGTHGIIKNESGEIQIEGSSTALYLHEIRHVGQSMKAGGLKFNSKGQLLNSRRTSQEGIDNEVEAYRVGYSYDSQYPEPASSLKDINDDSLKEIKREDGTPVYKDLYK